MWDSANIYGDSEDLLGKWYVISASSVVYKYSDFDCYGRRFQKTGKRNEIFLSTKVGITNDPARPNNGTPEYIKENFERSLKRLGGMHGDI